MSGSNWFEFQGHLPRIRSPGVGAITCWPWWTIINRRHPPAKNGWGSSCYLRCNSPPACLVAWLCLTDGSKEKCVDCEPRMIFYKLMVNIAPIKMVITWGSLWSCVCNIDMFHVWFFEFLCNPRQVVGQVKSYWIKSWVFLVLGSCGFHGSNGNAESAAKVVEASDNLYQFPAICFPTTHLMSITEAKLKCNTTGRMKKQSQHVKWFSLRQALRKNHEKS